MHTASKCSGGSPSYPEKTRKSRCAPPHPLLDIGGFLSKFAGVVRVCFQPYAREMPVTFRGSRTGEHTRFTPAHPQAPFGEISEQPPAPSSATPYGGEEVSQKRRPLVAQTAKVPSSGKVWGRYYRAAVSHSDASRPQPRRDPPLFAGYTRASRLACGLCLSIRKQAAQKPLRCWGFSFSLGEQDGARLTLGCLDSR